jgi:hypothetical protein
MTDLVPFANDAAQVSIDRLTIENGTDRIVLHGSLEIGRDRQGLERALRLKHLLDQAVTTLQSETLPAERPTRPPGSVANPFA